MTRRSAARWKVPLSLLLAFHLFAVFLAPLHFATRYYPGNDAAPIADSAMGWLRPYIDFCYLQHGYFFFAPIPGPSHLVNCDMQFADGRAAETYVLPDRRRHRPRLLYHRHFMLAEWMNTTFTPPQPPAEVTDSRDRERFARSRALYERLRASYSDHLAKRYGAEHVPLTRVEHRLPGIDEVTRDGKPLTAGDLYVDLSENAPPLPPSPLPTPPRAAGGTP